MHDYLVYHAKARTEGINIFQYTRVGLIDKIMQYIFFYFFFPEVKLFGKGVRGRRRPCTVLAAAS